MRIILIPFLILLVCFGWQVETWPNESIYKFINIVTGAYIWAWILGFVNILEDEDE